MWFVEVPGEAAQALVTGIYSLPDKVFGLCYQPPPFNNVRCYTPYSSGLLLVRRRRTKNII